MEPVHVLIASPSRSSTGTSSTVTDRLYPELQNDYVARRRKANAKATENETPSQAQATSESIRVPPSKNSLTLEETQTFWGGVSRIERSLVLCCEMTDEQEEIPVGTLDKDKEVRFAGVLAQDCHSMSSRSLALAILERTLDTYLIDQQESLKRAKLRLDDSNINASPTKTTADGDTNLSSEEEDDDEDDQPTPKRRRQSRRLQSQPPQVTAQPSRKRRRPVESKGPAKPEPTIASSPPPPSMDYHKWNRLEQFLAAGGLKILNRWLMEAFEPSAPTRPLILPILQFLEHIPLDKELVVDSKINKQIKKIEKKVSTLLSSRGEFPKEWRGWGTIPNVSSDREALKMIRQAIQDVKEAWGGKQDSSATTLADPFASIQKSLKERLQTLLDYEAGSTPAPAWLQSAEEVKAAPTAQSSSPAHNTQELAAKERQAEREAMKQRLRDAQEDHRKYLARLRELRKSQQENQVSPTKITGKKVKWKDATGNPSTQASRVRRQLLEEVFVFSTDSPANKDMDEGVEENDMEEE
eukprot:Nitzschia sp. Nitz4//scaffold9_size221794//18192//19769//NITZ4_001316-RA/size221794-processed-gene-0.305-mRNA-1//-1//CDS//3329560911//5909//frame0